MNETALAAKPVEDLLDLIVKSLDLSLTYKVAHSPDGEASSPAELYITFSGPDASLLTASNGELLHAIEHIAAKILNLEPEQHDRISLDADGFKQQRHQELQLSARTAIEHVQRTGQPFAFPPMSSRERRMLHLALQNSGLPTASSGMGPRRFVVLYPQARVAQAMPSAPPVPARASNIRNAFRPR